MQSNRLGHSVAEVDFVVAEVSDEIADINLLDLDSGNDDVVVLVGGESLLVVVEQVQDLVEQLVENGITHAGLAKFKGRRAVFPNVVEFGHVTKEVLANSQETSVVSGVDAATGSFDELSEDVETLGLVKRQESTLGGDDVSTIDGVNNSLLQNADEFHQFVVVVAGSDDDVLLATGEFNAVNVTEVGLEGSLDVLVVGVEFLDGTETLTNTLEVVTGEQLLVNVVEISTVANLIDETFIDSVLLLVTTLGFLTKYTL